MGSKQKVVVVGAGPVGSLAALYAAQRGHEVEIYELRNDLRDPSTTPLNFTRSINLALSERGINALRHAGQPRLLEDIVAATIPMRGRMIHGKRPSGELTETTQDYDIHGRAILAIDRAGLNKRLLDTLEGMDNVKILFNHKLTGADFRQRKAWFEVQGSGKETTGRAREIEIDFDLMIGADGAHSAARYHLMKFVRMDYTQEYIDTLWCEFQIQPREVGPGGKPESRFAISPNHLHIWPGKDFMFIAIPSEDGAFTCTLFMPTAEFAALDASPSQLPAFFDRHFPGVTDLIPSEDLIASFKTNPHLPLISVKCSPYHHSSSAVIVGDAAHAMVPFYGQGMNAGLEDVRILFSILDKHAEMARNNNNNNSGHDGDRHHRARALAEYTAVRKPDAHAINDLALQNYVEMRASVLSPAYRLRKRLEELLSAHVPSLGWQTRYARVAFGNEPYSDVVRRTDRQGDLLVRTLLGSPVLAAVVWAVVSRRKSLRRSVATLISWISLIMGRG
ncbi:kynurenine 3-monooxygenase [Magnaporthiopsis poae ATCC 64411]|uniref:Kynurenine 3-monooxygenase n=1 Tax=Magnaporthiopsis poae (strain ATCC 64411 / 73-15) TaxID=644358 RepID=A0A0C4DZZ2_MAGP6|nr:kynurenine 3-monooxygenase [Magnaporthiopsis poae ATCC 64411]